MFEILKDFRDVQRIFKIFFENFQIKFCLADFVYLIQELCGNFFI